MRRQLHFFATSHDLLPILNAVEERIGVKYVCFGHFDSQAPFFEKAELLPGLGHSSSESSIVSMTYIISLKTAKVTGRKIWGTGKYAFDQMINRGTVIFTAGGWWNKDVLISGRIATIHDDDDAQTLMKEYARLLKKRTVRIQSFWVGPEAEAFLDSGGRLTFSAQSPPEYNLARKIDP